MPTSRHKFNLLLFSILIFLIFTPGFSQVQYSILPNGGLESLVEKCAAHWDTLPIGARLVDGDKITHSGSIALEMDFSSAATLRWAHRPFPIAPGEEYTFELYYMVPELLNKGFVRFFWRWLSSYEGGEGNTIYYEFLPGVIGSEKVSNWTKYSASLVAPDGSVAAEFVISGEEAYDGGKVYFDDFSLIPPRETITTRLYMIDRRHIYGIDSKRKADARMDLLDSLAGLLYQAKSGEYIYLYDDLNPTHQKWALRLASRFKVQLDYRFDKDSPDLLWEIVNYFKDKIEVKEYILFSYDIDNSVRWAASLAGLKHCLIMDESIAQLGEQAIGLTKKLDLTQGYDEDKVWNMFKNHPEANRSLLLENFTDYGKDYRHYLNDLAVAQKAWIFWDPKEAGKRRAFYLGWAEDNSFYLGCGAGDEGIRTGQTSIYGLTCVPADWCWNMGTLPAFTDSIEPWRLRARPLTMHDLEWEDGVIYVTFILTDGDNLQVLQGDWFFNPKFWGSTYRGKFALGWQWAPTVTRFIPAIFESVYANDSPWCATANDGFVCGNSGMGYHYVGVRDDRAFGAATLQGKGLIAEHGKILNNWLKTHAVNVVTVMPWDREDWLASNFDNYAGQIERLLGFLVNTYSGSYRDAHGEIKWTKDAQGNDVPVKALNESLWERSANAKDIIRLINDRPIPKQTDENAFIYIGVHAWSWKNPVAEVARCVSAFAPHVRVVRPDELLMQIRLRLRPQQELGNYAKRISNTLAELSQISTSTETFRNSMKQAGSLLSLGKEQLALSKFRKSFDILKKADYYSEIARLSAITFKQKSKSIKLIISNPREPLYFFDATELWQNAPKVAVYHVQVDNTPDFSPPLIYEELNFTNDELLIRWPEAYIRVRGRSTIHNIWGDWSKTFKVKSSQL